MSEFFSEQRENSIVKTSIVTKYFDAWSKIMKNKAIRNGKPIAYIDLFAGQGVYDDGGESTPMLITRTCLADPVLASNCKLYFNDGDEERIAKLKENLYSIEGFERLQQNVSFSSRALTIEESRRITAPAYPSFVFVDPCGYCGLTMELIQTFLNTWGTDIVFFFNIRRVNAAITNPRVDNHMIALFTEDGLSELNKRIECENPTPERRRMIILDSLINNIKSASSQKLFILPFEFSTERGVSHYLVFVSKSITGFTIMKDIMSKASSLVVQGFGSFKYCPQEQMYGLGLLASFASPLEDLGGELLRAFVGKKLTVKDVIDRHSPTTYYTIQNYKNTLHNLEGSGRILAEPPAVLRRKNTLGDDVLLSFPSS